MTTSALLVMAFGFAMVAYGISPWVSYRAKAFGTQEVPKAWFYTVLAFAVCSTLNAVMIVPPLLVEISTDLDISVAVAGQLATATFGAWAISVASVGPLSDSFGRRPVALAGLFLLVVSVLGSAFAPNLETLLALRVLTGFGGGTVPPNAVGVLSDVISPARRAQAVSGMIAINGLASAISVPMVAVLADLGGWRFAFLVSGLLLASGFLTTWVWFPRDNRERLQSWVFFSRYWSLMSLRFFKVGIPVGLTQRLAFWAMLSFFAAYLINTYELSVGFAALPLAIVAVAQIIGSYCAAFVATSRRRAALLAITSAGGGAFALLCFASTPGLWATVAVATMATGLLSVPMPALVSISTEYSGESKATGASLMGLSNQAGGLLGAGISGALLASMGYAGIGYLCFAVCIASTLDDPPVRETVRGRCGPGWRAVKSHSVRTHL